MKRRVPAGRQRESSLKEQGEAYRFVTDAKCLKLSSSVAMGKIKNADKNGGSLAKLTGREAAVSLRPS